MTKVSIIIPCYNQARYLAAAVDSCLAQTHDNVEIVVIDDGSPDNTAEVAARYRNRENFRYVRQENTGLGGARNRGIRESTGDYLCFLDSDDWYHPQKVARQAALLDANPEIGWSYCDITSVDESGAPRAEQFSIADSKRMLSGDIFGSLMLSGYFQPLTVMVRRSVLDQVGVFDPELGGYADYDLWLRIAGAGFHAVFVAEPLAFYRVHANSMSRDGEHMQATRLGAFRNIVKLHPERVAEALSLLQQTIIDLHDTLGWTSRRSRPAHAAEQPNDAAEAEYTRLTAAWRSKLDAALVLAGRHDKTNAAKLMLEAVKSIESCKNPRVLLEALTEVPAHLASIDPGRARYLLGVAVKLSASLGNTASHARATALLAGIQDAA